MIPNKKSSHFINMTKNDNLKDSNQNEFNPEESEIKIVDSFNQNVNIYSSIEEHDVQNSNISIPNKQQQNDNYID